MEINNNAESLKTHEKIKDKLDKELYEISVKATELNIQTNKLIEKLDAVWMQQENKAQEVQHQMTQLIGTAQLVYNMKNAVDGRLHNIEQMLTWLGMEITKVTHKLNIGKECEKQESKKPWYTRLFYGDK